MSKVAGPNLIGLTEFVHEYKNTLIELKLFKDFYFAIKYREYQNINHEILHPIINLRCRKIVTSRQDYHNIKLKGIF